MSHSSSQNRSAFQSALAAAILLIASTAQAEIIDAQPVDGYRGIWYSNQATNDEYRFKYSGGLGTYPQQHAPIAIYSPEANRTYFCYGGTTGKPKELACMISYFDHETNQAAQPRMALLKHVNDAHENPTLQLDAEGHVWLFCSAHGPREDAYILRSVKPQAIDQFEIVEKTNFSYSQPWYIPGEGFLFLHTRYENGKRMLFWKTSRDGREWSEQQPLARAASGHYQISQPLPRGAATAFNVHPAKGGLNARTNLYYLATENMGATWRTAAGREVEFPITSIDNDALIYDYQAEGKLVYLKDLNFDAAGRPVIVYLTTDGYAPGPANGERQWWTAHWTGDEWRRRPITVSDHNYDFGSIYVEGDEWRLLAPTDPGPQPYTTGGEMVLWTSRDEGATWQRTRQVTQGSQVNQTYARRPVNAHPDFYALWADGNPLERSPSTLYFTNRAGDVVRPLLAP